jgi:hypothetical protein
VGVALDVQIGDAGGIGLTKDLGNEESGVVHRAGSPLVDVGKVSGGRCKGLRYQR